MFYNIFNLKESSIYIFLVLQWDYCTLQTHQPVIPYFSKAEVILLRSLCQSALITEMNPPYRWIWWNLLELELQRHVSPRILIRWRMTGVNTCPGQLHKERDDQSHATKPLITSHDNLTSRHGSRLLLLLLPEMEIQMLIRDIYWQIMIL